MLHPPADIYQYLYTKVGSLQAVYKLDTASLSRITQ